MPSETLAILLVDDNPADACLIQEMLRDVEAFQFQLICVSKLEDAWTYPIATSSIAVILLNLSLPNPQWVDTITQLRLVVPDVPILIISECSDEALANSQALEALQNGAQDYLVKHQLDGKQLVRSIRYALARQNAIAKLDATTSCASTQVHQAHEAVLKSEATLRTLYESISVAVILLDENGIFAGNDAALELFDCTDKQQLCGKPMADVSPPVQPTGEASFLLAKEYVGTAFQAGSCRFDWLYCKRNGETFPAKVTLTRINLENRQLLQAVIYDISDRKATETQLLQAKEEVEAGYRAKSEFLATISHELRTPLNSILGLSQLMQQDIFGTLNDKQKELMSCIHSSGEHLLALINDILDISKVEAGKEQLHFVPLNVQQLCEYCLAMVRKQAMEQGLELVLRIDPHAKIAIADERRCRQMLLNLLSNAVKFTPAGQVLLIVTKEPQGICFTVEDTGIGIASDQLPLLFEPFRQLDSGLNRRFPGTGLGLALTRSLAHLHGGDVTVKSTVGKGSQFTLCLPDWQNEELIGPSSSQASGMIQGESHRANTESRILLVDGDGRSAIVLKDYLQVIGHSVEHLTDGKDFLETVRQFNPNLILMDVELAGDCTGLDLLIALRREPDMKNLKIVMLAEAENTLVKQQVSVNRIHCDQDYQQASVNNASVHSRQLPTQQDTSASFTSKVAREACGHDIAQRCLEAGADDYLSKPIGIAQLEAILMRYL
ncbi:MAG TPA: ATP-binding protein [Coleofasciculaceae cyanobacterium]